MARRGTPRAPEDLVAHQWVGAPRDGAVLSLTLSAADGRAQTLRIEPRITSNNQLTLQQLCVAGLGIGLMVQPDVEDDLRDGRLVALLPGWARAPIDVWAVTPQRDRQPANVRYAIAALLAHLQRLPGAMAP